MIRMIRMIRTTPRPLPCVTPRLGGVEAGALIGFGAKPFRPCMHRARTIGIRSWKGWKRSPNCA